MSGALDIDPTVTSTMRPQTIRVRCRIKLVFLLLPLISLLGLLAPAQEGAAERPAAALVKCALCHRPDERGRLSRIAFQRKTPEGWQATVRRMIRMHGLSMSLAEAKTAVKYLSDHQGLAPTEVRPIAYLLERRDVRERVPNAAVRQACVRCHSFARIAAQRRTAEEWRKLKTFHLAVFPTLVYQMRQIDWPAIADQAITYLARRFPYRTEAWQHRPPRFNIEGQWKIVGHRPGHGDFFGDIDITALGKDRFRTQERFIFTDGRFVARRGKGILYAGFAWRGSAQSSDGQPIKEVLHFSEDGKQLEGRWFLAASDQIGADVSLYRQGDAPRILGLSRRSLQAPSMNVKVEIYGANFSPSLTAKEIDVGQGVIVHQLKIKDSGELEVTLDVEADAPPGVRDVRVGDAIGKAGVTVFERIDYIKVEPALGLARVGGLKARKQYQQFEALAFSNGPDGAPGTGDDIAVGPVPADWRIEEDSTDPDDDDAKFVGSIDQHGLFTPANDGPNPKRRKKNNNVGQVRVVASYTPPGTRRALSARAHLIVTVPLFIDSEVR